MTFPRSIQKKEAFIYPFVCFASKTFKMAVRDLRGKEQRKSLNESAFGHVNGGNYPDRHPLVRNDA